MKKVIFKNDENVVKISEITDDMFVGVEWYDGTRSLVLKKDDGRFKGVCPDTFNDLDQWCGPSIQSYVSQAKSLKGESFVFETGGKLLKWVLKL